MKFLDNLIIEMIKKTKVNTISLCISLSVVSTRFKNSFIYNINHTQNSILILIIIFF